MLLGVTFADVGGLAGKKFQKKKETMGAPLFVFGILVLAIVIGRILWSKIS